MNLGKIRQSNTFRVLFIGLLILLLLIPMNMVKSVVRERQSLHLSASNEIKAAWGKRHSFTGPVLTLSYYRSSSLDI